MSNVYQQYIDPSINSATLLPIMVEKLSHDPDVTVAVTSSSYDAPSSTITINFASNLTDFQFNVLNYMVNIIFYNQIPGVNFYFPNAINEPRNVYTQDFVPSATDDLYCGYNVGSMICDSNTVKCYKCLDPTVNNAIWIDISQALSTFNDYIVLTKTSPENVNTSLVSSTSFNLSWDVSSITNSSFFNFNGTDTVTINDTGRYLIIVSSDVSSTVTLSATMSVNNANTISSTVSSLVSVQNMNLIYPVTINSGTQLQLNYNIPTLVTSVFTVGQQTNMSIIKLGSDNNNLYAYANRGSTTTLTIPVTTQTTIPLDSIYFSSDNTYLSYNSTYDAININKTGYYNVSAEFLIQSTATTGTNADIQIIAVTSISPYSSTTQIVDSNIIVQKVGPDTSLYKKSFQINVTNTSTILYFLAYSYNGNMQLPSSTNITSYFNTNPFNTVSVYIVYNGQ